MTAGHASYASPKQGKKRQRSRWPGSPLLKPGLALSVGPDRPYAPCPTLTMHSSVATRAMVMHAGVASRRPIARSTLPMAP